MMTSCSSSVPRGSALGPSRASPSCPRAWPPGEKAAAPAPEKNNDDDEEEVNEEEENDD